MRIKWMKDAGMWREKSAFLQYRIGEGEWTTIQDGLDNTGFYMWAAPLPETDKLQVRVGMVTKDGNKPHLLESEIRQSNVSGDIRVKTRGRGDKKTAMRHYNAARLLHAQGKAADAIIRYEKSLEAWPEYPEALHELGRVYYEEEEWARALEFWRRSMEASPSSPFPYVNVAKAKLKLKLYEDAFNDLKDAVALGVDRNRHLGLACSEALLRVAIRYGKTNEVEQAIDACKHVLRIRNVDPKVRAQAEKYLEWALGPEESR
jgi:tetratricopeptide (TPR) repeat protein